MSSDKLIMFGLALLFLVGWSVFIAGMVAGEIAYERRTKRLLRRNKE